MTYAAFDYAQQDRNPVLILTDGVMGTIMEPVALPPKRSAQEVKVLKDAVPQLGGGRPRFLKEPRAPSMPGAGTPRSRSATAKGTEELYKSWPSEAETMYPGRRRDRGHRLRHLRTHRPLRRKAAAGGGGRWD